VKNGLRVGSVAAFARGLPVRFQRGRAGTLALRVHFTFRGSETAELTVDLRDQAISLEKGLTGAADLHVTADTRTWLDVVNGNRSLFWALVLRRVRVRGPLRLLRDFGRCFPG